MPAPEVGLDGGIGDVATLTLGAALGVALGAMSMVLAACGTAARWGGGGVGGRGY